LEASTDELAQCHQCHRYTPPEALKCPFCNALMPGGKALRATQARDLSPQQRAQREAYERLKMEYAHVPPWLRKLVNFFTYAYNEPFAHRIVQGGSGLLAFGMAFGAAEALRGSMPQYLQGMTFIGLQIMLGVVAFYFASQWAFWLFQKNVENMLMLWGDEQDVRVMQGKLAQQYQDWRKNRN
jgi:hypothetical protein